MLKKLFGLAAAALLLACPVAVLGGCDKAGGNLYYRAVGNGWAVVRCANKSGETAVDIPAEFRGKPVTQVADFGVVNADQVKTIRIGKNIEAIGAWAFTNNQNLEAFTVDGENRHFAALDGVLYSKDGKTLLFYPPARGAAAATNGSVLFSIPDGVETVRSKAFYKCGKLTGVRFPPSVKHIEEKAFCYAETLGNFVLPEGLLRIEKDAFSFCPGLTAVVIPSTVEYIGDFAFYNDQNIRSFQVNRAEKDTAGWGEKWYPTQNGDELSGLVIEYRKPGT